MINSATSLLASTLRGWRGTGAIVRQQQPDNILVLYDMEGCPYCRAVREVLTELDLDVMVKPCPKGCPGHWSELETLSGQRRVPFLVDDNQGEKLAGSEAIVDYLYRVYGRGRTPRATGSVKLGTLATAVRFAKGVNGRPAKPAEQPLELYSFESSPFSRPVRERLCELGIAHIVRNSGKQQRSDIGLPWLRPNLGPYEPIAGTNRARLKAATGKVQFPYLYDPNTGKGLFESGDIVRYLQKQYGGFQNA